MICRGVVDNARNNDGFTLVLCTCGEFVEDNCHLGILLNTRCTGGRTQLDIVDLMSLLFAAHYERPVSSGAAITGSMLHDLLQWLEK